MDGLRIGVLGLMVGEFLYLALQAYYRQYCTSQVNVLPLVSFSPGSLHADLWRCDNCGTRRALAGGRTRTLRMTATMKV